jgi:hypothetical protein
MALSPVKEQLYVNLLVKNFKNMGYIIDRTHSFYDIDILHEYPLPVHQEIQLIKKFIKRIKFHRSGTITITPKNKQLDTIDYIFL